MIEVAEELIEAVHRGQVLVTVTLVVLAELTCGVAEALQHGCHGHVSLLPTFLGSGHAYLGHAGTDRNLAIDEGCASGSAGLLAVVVGKPHTLPDDAIDVGCCVAHHATVIVANVPGSDVVTPDDENVGFVLCLRIRNLRASNTASKMLGFISFL